jgi:hypothetical protein
LRQWGGEWLTGKLHDGGSDQSMGSHQCEAGQEVEELIGLVRVVLGVALVLTEDELEPDSARGGLSVVRPSQRRMKSSVARR